MMNGPFPFILLIIAMFCITKVLKARYQAKAGIVEDEAGNQTLVRQPVQQNDAENLRLKSEVEELRERLHVLERIATDGHEAKNLSAEIEQLRDKD